MRRLEAWHVVVGVAVAFALYRVVARSPEGRVLIEDYIRKNGVCYLVRQMSTGETTSTRVDDRFCS